MHRGLSPSLCGYDTWLATRAVGIASPLLRWRFAEETKTRRGLRTVLIAAEGAADGSYRGEFHALVTSDALFAG